MSSTKIIFELAYDEFSASLVDLFELYAKRNDDIGQQRLSDEIDALRKDYSLTSEKYAAFLAEIKSRSSSSGSIRSGRSGRSGRSDSHKGALRGDYENEQCVRISNCIASPITIPLISRNERLDSERNLPIFNPPVERNPAIAIDIDEQIPVRRVCDNSTSPLAVARDQVNQAI